VKSRRQGLSGVVTSACALAVLGVCLVQAAAVNAAAWRGYLNDADRSGATKEKVPTPLVKCWTFQSRKPFWPAVVAGHGGVYFGTPTDNAVYGLDAKTGKIRWRRVVGGRMYFSPALVREGVCVGADDGYVYCLDVKDGSPKWRFRAAPVEDRILMHGMMQSRWPVRGAPGLRDNVLYVGCGVWPGEGSFFYGLNPDTGRVVWQYDSRLIHSDGYLTVAGGMMVVPQSRLNMIAVDLKTQKLSHVTGRKNPGWRAQVAGNLLFAGTHKREVIDTKTRARVGTLQAHQMVTTPKMLYVATGKELQALAYGIEETPKGGRKLKTTLKWKAPCTNSSCLILAGDVLFAGGKGSLIALSANDGKALWKSAPGEIDGNVYTMAAAEGRLFACTMKGRIYSYGPKGSSTHGVVTHKVKKAPYERSATKAVFKMAADAILKQTGVTRGYAVVYGVETGELALELAKRTKLSVYAVSPDAAKVAAAREELDATGLLGTRVFIDHHAMGEVPYPDYFADLIVSETATLTGKVPGKPGEVLRMLKPIRGQMMIGQPVRIPHSTFRIPQLNKWFSDSPLGKAKIVTKGGTWALFTRPPLEGARDWTQQFADAGNNACSKDELVKGPIGVLWYGPPMNATGDRHCAPAGPVVYDGRVFSVGANRITRAVDIYNGLILWEQTGPGDWRMGAACYSGSVAASPHGFFSTNTTKCFRLDPETGKTLSTYSVPKNARKSTQWGCLAVDGDLLFGSGVPPKAPLHNHQTPATCVFALDIKTGKPRWVYEQFPVNLGTVAIGDGTVYLFGGAATKEQKKQVTDQTLAFLAKRGPKWHADRNAVKKGVEARMLTALDIKTGKVKWSKPSMDIFPHARRHVGRILIYAQGVLIQSSVTRNVGACHVNRWVNWISARSAKDGSLMWTRQAKFLGRPVVVGDSIYLDPVAIDLRTGKDKVRAHPTTGRPWVWMKKKHGARAFLSASQHAMFGRPWSSTMGYYDLMRDAGIVDTPGTRASCWVSMIPAGGLVVALDGRSGCGCVYHMQPWSVVFKHNSRDRSWSQFISTGPMTPVRNLYLNLGAPGDMRDDDGNIWLGAEIGKRMGRHEDRRDITDILEPGIEQTWYPGGSRIARDPGYTKVEGTDRPWIFGTVARGLRSCTIPLLAKKDGGGRYKVKLYFCDLDNDEAGKRVFDVKLQGKRVLKRLDIVKESGGRMHALVKTFEVDVTDKLVIDLESAKKDPDVTAMPVLCGVECIRKK